MLTENKLENKETEQCDLQTWEYSYLDKDGNTIIAIWTICCLYRTRY